MAAVESLLAMVAQRIDFPRRDRFAVFAAQKPLSPRKCEESPVTLDAIATSPMTLDPNRVPSTPVPATTPSAPESLIRDLGNLFKLLADETRLRILSYLMHDPELHVRAMCEMLHQSQPAVSHHLALLREAGLIACRREGKHNFYHVVPTRFQEFLDTILSSVPQKDRRVRLEDYVLMYSPAVDQK